MTSMTATSSDHTSMTLDDALNEALVETSLQPKQAADAVLSDYSAEQILDWCRVEVKQLLTERASRLRAKLREDIKADTTGSGGKSRKIMKRLGNATVPRSILADLDPRWGAPVPFLMDKTYAELTREDVDGLISRIQHGITNYRALLDEAKKLKRLFDTHGVDDASALIKLGVAFPT